LQWATRINKNPDQSLVYIDRTPPETRTKALVVLVHVEYRLSWPIYVGGWPATCIHRIPIPAASFADAENAARCRRPQNAAKGRFASMLFAEIIRGRFLPAFRAKSVIDPVLSSICDRLPRCRTNLLLAHFGPLTSPDCQ